MQFQSKREWVVYSEIKLQQTLSNSTYYNWSILRSVASSFIQISKTIAIPKTIELGILMTMLNMAIIY